jgi:hypothetical protein
MITDFVRMENTTSGNERRRIKSLRELLGLAEESINHFGHILNDDQCVLILGVRGLFIEDDDVR